MPLTDFSIAGTDSRGSNPVHSTEHSAIAKLLTGQPWYNVMSYGATGDGSTDDAAAIQAALTAAGDAGGGIVYFPEATYIVGTRCDIPANVTVMGCGAGTVIKCKAATVLTGIFRINSVARAGVVSCRFDGNAVSDPALLINDATNATVAGCSFTASDYWALRVSGASARVDIVDNEFEANIGAISIIGTSSRVLVSRNTFKNWTAPSASLFYAGCVYITTTGGFLRISDNDFESGSGSYIHCIMIDGPANCAITGNTFDGTNGTYSEQQAINAGATAGCNGLVVQGNVCVAMPAQFVFAASLCQNVTIMANVIKNCGRILNPGAVIEMSGSGLNTVSGNTIDTTSNSVSGIYCGSRAVVSGNTVIAAYRGIQVYDGGSYSLITGNTVKSSRDSGIHCDSSSPTISGVIVSDCTITDSGAYGLVISNKMTKLRYDNLTFYNNTSGTISDAGTSTSAGTTVSV